MIEREREIETRFEKVPRHTHAHCMVHNVFIFSSYFGSNPNKLLCFKPPDPHTIKPHYTSTVYLVTWKNIVSIFVADGRFSIYVMSIDRYTYAPQPVQWTRY